MTRWSKLGTAWRGVLVRALLDQVEQDAQDVLAFSDGGDTTNLPVKDVSGGQAWLAFDYDGQPLAPEHGGPARLLVPHLYFWKSAKWVRGLELLDHDQPGFWENYGYNNYGDPWREQRYAGVLRLRGRRHTRPRMACQPAPSGIHMRPTPFVETVSELLVTRHYPSSRVKTERFGGARMALDGKAIGGLLLEIFGSGMTSAEAGCACVDLSGVAALEVDPSDDSLPRRALAPSAAPGS